MGKSPHNNIIKKFIASLDDLEYDSEYKLIYNVCDYCDLKIIKYVVGLVFNLECKDNFQHG